MTWALAFLLTAAGFLLLALSQAKNHRELLGAALAPGRARAFQAGGWALLLAAYVACGLGFGWGYGTVVEIALLNAAGLLLALWITYGPKRAPARTPNRMPDRARA